MSEDNKMLYEFNAWWAQQDTGLGDAYRFTAWNAWKDCAAIKDAEIAKEMADHKLTIDTYRNYIEPRHKAEIAARDLMIKELRDALIGFMGNPNFDGEPFRKGAEALANSEHHNSRALEKMLLEARIDEINRLSCWHPLEGNWEEFVRAQAQDYEIRLAELTNQSLSNTGE